MEGVDIHLDVNVGKQLSALGHTLTTLTSVQEDDVPQPSYDSDDADTNENPDASQVCHHWRGWEVESRKQPDTSKYHIR